MAFKKGSVSFKKKPSEDMKIAVISMAWHQLQGLIAYADGIIKKDGFEAVFNDEHEKHKPWKKTLINKSLEYAKDLGVKSMPTEIVGENGGPIRLIYRASTDKAE